jgi:hypothetical protein
MRRTPRNPAARAFDKEWLRLWKEFERTTAYKRRGAYDAKASASARQRLDEHLSLSADEYHAKDAAVQLHCSWMAGRSNRCCASSAAECEATG